MWRPIRDVFLICLIDLFFYPFKIPLEKKVENKQNVTQKCLCGHRTINWHESNSYCHSLFIVTCNNPFVYSASFRPEHWSWQSEDHWWRLVIVHHTGRMQHLVKFCPEGSPQRRPARQNHPPSKMATLQFHPLCNFIQRKWKLWLF